MTAPPSEASKALPGADAVYLSISADTVTLRCDMHQTYERRYPYGDDGRVPASWLVSALASHMKDHAEPAEEASDQPQTTTFDLDPFGREVAARARWATQHNEGDPNDAWPDQYRIAVALVLGNHEYLRDMGPGPGYTPAEAAVLLVRGMTHRPANLDIWIKAVRGAVLGRGQADVRGVLWMPSSALRHDL